MISIEAVDFWYSNARNGHDVLCTCAVPTVIYLPVLFVYNSLIFRPTVLGLLCTT